MTGMESWDSVHGSNILIWGQPYKFSPVKWGEWSFVLPTSQDCREVLCTKVLWKLGSTLGKGEIILEFHALCIAV